MPNDNDFAERSQSLVQRIANALAKDIVMGEYRPGDRIGEQELANRFATSRAPVREALRLLENEGLLVKQPRLGARVAELTIDDFEDLFELLAALMGVVAKLACKNGSRQQLIDFASQVRFFNNEKVIEKRIAHSFHLAGLLRKASGSPLVSAMLLRISRLAYLGQVQVLKANEAWHADAGTLWLALATAVVERDGAAAEQHARAIISMSQEFTLQQLRARQP